MKQTVSFSVLDHLRYLAMACGLVLALFTMVSLVAPARAVSGTASAVLADSGDLGDRARDAVGGLL